MQAPSTSSLLSHYDDTMVEQARADYRRRKVVSIAWSNEDTLTGKVSASKGIYTSKVHLEADRSAVCCVECTCDFGRERMECRHSASVLLAYLEDPSSIAPYAGTKDSSNSALCDLTSATGGHTNTSRQNMPAAFQDFMATIFEAGAPDIGKAARSKEHKKKIPAAQLKSDQGLETGLTLLARALNQGQGSGPLPSPTSTKTRFQSIYVIHTNVFEPTIDVFEVSVKKDGTFGTRRELDIDEQPSPSALQEDKNIYAFWQSLTFWQIDRTNGYSSNNDDFAPCFKVLLTRMLQTGRARLGSIDGPALALGPELPGRLSWQSIHDTKRLQVVAEDNEIVHPCTSWCIPWYLDKTNNILGPVKHDIPEAAVKVLNYIRPLHESDVVATTCLLADLGLSQIIPELINNQNIEVRLSNEKPRLVATALTFAKSAGKSDSAHTREEKRALLLTFPPSWLTDTAYIDAAGKTIIERQDRSSESAQIAQIASLGFRDVTAQVDTTAENDHFFFAQHPTAFANLDTQTLKQLRSGGIEISRETEDALRPVQVTEKDIRIELKDERGFWSTMELHIDVQGKKMPLLPILRAAIDRLSEVSGQSIDELNHKGNFVADLPDGSLITMPFERIKTMLLALVELLDKETDKLQVSALHAAQLLNEMGNARWSGSAKISELAAQLKALKFPKTVAPPKSFKASLRPYQLEGLAWLQLISRFKLGGILADDMGLGKTIQILAHIAIEKESGRLRSPFLVVCPTSVLPNWLAELERFAPDLSLIAHSGQNRSQAALLDQAQNVDVVLTTYPLLTRDIETLKQISFHGLALDEAQTIKNPLAKVAQNAKLINANHKYCLTGTPVENHLGELWSQFDFLMPGILGDKARFNRHLRTPIEKYGDIERQIALAGRIKPFVLRRTKQEVLRDLPDKTVIIKQIELSGKQLDLYETVRLACTEQIQKEIARKGFNQSQIVILDAMLKLRQVCCDPALVNLPTAKTVDESAKLETLMEMIEQLSEEGKRMLVFSQFTSMLDLIADQLRQRSIGFVELRGDTKDRVAPVKTFQESNVPVFLLSLKAGGVGLNLTAADTVIHYDPWWNPASEDQATDRAYRIGQSKDVFVYKLIAHGTIEQWMLAMQDRKRVLANTIYDKNGNLGAAFTEEDLANLLRPIERI